MTTASTYDIGIIGAGVSGVFAALRLAEKHKNLKSIVFEFGPPPPNCLRQDPIHIKRRRRQLEGWFGCFPTGDGKVYVEEDANKVLEVADGRKVKMATKFFSSQIEEINTDKLIKTKLPNQTVKKKAEEEGFSFIHHTYQQWSPEMIHQLSKISADKIEEAGNIVLSFDTDVFTILKTGKSFKVVTSQGDFSCKKLILCVGRSGWRWVNKLYSSFGILLENDYTSYGIRAELPASTLKEFNKSHCSFVSDGLSVGPINWFGSIIQEDHADVTIASFRSNEDRWKTDKAFFSIKKKIKQDGEGWQQTDRIAKLSYLLSGDRVGREKLKSFLKKTDQISLLPEYAWLPEAVEIINTFIPNLSARGYFHVPDVDTNTTKINIASNLETEVEGLFVAGESAGIKGIAAAGIMGVLAVDGALK